MGRSRSRTPPRRGKLIQKLALTKLTVNANLLMNYVIEYKNAIFSYVHNKYK